MITLYFLMDLYMKKAILALTLLLGSSTVASQSLVYTSDDGINVFGRGSVERTLSDGHCRQDEDPYVPDRPSDFCDKGHLDA